ncbi:hypothetical protein NC651_028431 [Populus alba x Populus x berolinensis]|nr:hypothetical protein NC651_028431 [Populus alba x Populus x berolinensis]
MHSPISPMFIPTYTFCWHFTKSCIYWKCNYHGHQYRRIQSVDISQRVAKLFARNATITNIYIHEYSPSAFVSAVQNYRYNHRWIVRIPKVSSSSSEDDMSLSADHEEALTPTHNAASSSVVLQCRDGVPLQRNQFTHKYEAYWNDDFSMLVFREPKVTVAPQGSQVTIYSSLLAIYSCFCHLCMYPACKSGNKWVSRKSKGKMSPSEASSKEPNQTQSMFPLLYLPLFPVPA